VIGNHRDTAHIRPLVEEYIAGNELNPTRLYTDSWIGYNYLNNDHP